MEYNLYLTFIYTYYKYPYILLLCMFIQSFAIDKRSGKKCYMIGARRLSITWGDTQTYWQWIPKWRRSRYVKSLSPNLLFRNSYRF